MSTSKAESRIVGFIILAAAVVILYKVIKYFQVVAKFSTLLVFKVLAFFHFGANVVVLGIAERNRQPISFWQFTKYGLVVTVVTVALSAGYVWLRYFALT